MRRIIGSSRNSSRGYLFSTGIVPSWLRPSGCRHTSLMQSSPCATADASISSCSEAAPPPSGGKKLILVVAIALLRLEAGGGAGNGGGAGSLGPAPSVLLAQRPPGKANEGLWEFPGGKVEAGETPEQALVRELQEELGIKVEEHDLWPLTFTSHSYPHFHLLMPLYGCTRWSGEPRGAEGQALAWASEAQVVAGAETQRGAGGGATAAAAAAGVQFPLCMADVPMVPEVVRALRRCS